MEHPSNEYIDLVDLIAHKESKVAELDRFVRLLRKWSGVFLIGISLVYAGLLLIPLDKPLQRLSPPLNHSSAYLHCETSVVLYQGPKPPIDENWNYLSPPPNWRKLRLGEIITYEIYGCMGQVSSYIIYP